MKLLVSLLIAVSLLLGHTAAPADAPQPQPQSDRLPYGVFLSLDNSTMDALEGYQTVVIDAQYFEAGDIERLHADGHIVYSYLNVGAIESFRDYYPDHQALFLGEYENWEEEQWIDVSDEGWQEFVADDLAGALIAKGVDGFFVDNCDVYYHYPSEDIFAGLVNILRRLTGHGVKVVINSGDAFADEYYERYGRFEDVFTGINQETVLSSIDFDNDRLGTQQPEDSEYYQAYITRFAERGADIYLLEYTTDSALIERIDRYCAEHGFAYYISDSIELD